MKEKIRGEVVCRKTKGRRKEKKQKRRMMGGGGGN